MNTTTLNMTTLDGGGIIKKGEGGGATINNQDKVVDITENGTTEVVADGGFTGLGKVTINTEVSGGGGADLEGEYFLAKPNGRYWKLNFITYSEDGIYLTLNWDSLNNEQQSAVCNAYSMLSIGSAVYTCVGEKVHKGGMIPKKGIYCTTYGKIQSDLGYSLGRMYYDSNKSELFSCFTWQEAYINIPDEESDYFPEGVTITSLFDYFKIVIELEQGYTMPDEEVYAMFSEMFMIEPITKEEYENFVSEAENEDY